MAKRFYVYILTNVRRGVLYVGVTSNIARRVSEHRAKFGAGFTAAHGLTQLVHIEVFDLVLEARARERTLKRWRRAWKFDLIEIGNPEWRDLSDDVLS